MADYEKRGYLLENFRLFHLRSEQAPGVEFHYHDFCKLLLLISGSGSYMVDGQRYQLQPGDAVMIGSRCIHRPELDPDVPYERIIVFISPEFLQRESTGDCSLPDCFSGENGHVLRLREPRRKKLFELAAALERDLNGEEYGRDIVSNAALLRVLVQLGREKRRTDAQSPHPVMPQNSRVLELMQYINRHLEEDLDIDALADAFYISRYHMMRLFHRETGTTIHAYLSQRRLMHARELINSGMRATDACYRSGFRSYSSFTRAYNKYFGTTPTGRIDSVHKREAEIE